MLKCLKQLLINLYKKIKSLKGLVSYAFFKTPSSTSFTYYNFFLMYRIEVLASSNILMEKRLSFSGVPLSPASGKKPDSMVVLFHGYGDTAENFLMLGVFLGQVLPNTLFVAVEGPLNCKDIPLGKKWLGTSKNNQSGLIREIKNLTPSLNHYLDKLLKIHNIPPQKVAFLGFSQGARIALHIGLRRPCAGIVALSGSYLEDPTTKSLLRPPVLICMVLKIKRPQSHLLTKHTRI